jgi:hypothetical protein
LGKIGLSVAVAALAVACARTDDGQRLSADELHRMVPGATLQGTVADGGTFEGTYFPDGTMAIRTDDDADTGAWDFDGDTVCLTWTKWRGGERYCIYWTREDEGYASYYVDGRLSTRFTIAE